MAFLLPDLFSSKTSQTWVSGLFREESGSNSNVRREIAVPADQFANLRLAAWRDALRVLVIQAIALVLATIGGLFFSRQTALGVLVGGAIGLLGNAYLAFALLGKPLLTGKHGDVRVGWLIKVVLTLSLLWIAMQAKFAPPPSLIAGLFSTILAQWLAVSFWLRR